jgi:phospholipid/cholesterol/gamma-HCH transport system substrate-binding protein
MKLPWRKKNENGEDQPREKWAGAPKALGFLIMALIVVWGVGAFAKDEIASLLTPGDKITASFTRQYRLQPYKSVVKIAGVTVGEVTGVESSETGPTKVSMRLNKGVVQNLGSEPSAGVRPTLLVGGIYYVELTPAGRGGAFSGDIPLSRTTVPVDLDQVLTPIDPSAQRGLQALVKQTDDTLQQGGREAIRNLVQNVPATLGPASDVLFAARGNDPSRDLPRLVTSLENFSADFTRKDGQLASTIDGLHTTSASLAAESGPVAQAMAVSPQTLATTRAGLLDLQPTLDKLTVTAPKFRDSAQELDPLLAKLDPVLRRARPVVSDLREVLDDADPLVHDLVPVVDKTTDAFVNVRGPVLDRLDGPIIQTLNSPWHGTGAYAGGGNDHLMYQEIAYFDAATDNIWKFHDQNGASGRLAAGVGGNSLTGGSHTPRTTEEYLESLGLNRPRGPQDATPRGERPAAHPPARRDAEPIIPPATAHGKDQTPGIANPAIPMLGGN